MKTAMQEAFKHQKLWIENGFTLEKWFENYEQNHLKKEKEQIINAFNEGNESDWSNEFGDGGEQYYNETFKSE